MLAVVVEIVSVCVCVCLVVYILTDAADDSDGTIMSATQNNN